ncbi:MAG: Na+-transporting NADH:ubiquinone oxidoreductase, subunit NqrB, partial [Deltaproteobacteria bacterium]
MDPRFYQIAFLSSFLVLGIVLRDFRVGWLEFGVVLGSAFLTQALAIWKWNLSRTSFRSAAISSLGLLMLIRTPSLL